MKRFNRLLPLPILFLLVFAPQVRADLSDEIRAISGDKLLNKGEYGIEIVRLGTSEKDSQVIYEFKSTVPRVPASNLKLATTSTALEKLGASFEFKTTFAKRGNDVALIGDGDPTLGDVEMLRKLGWGVDTVFVAWAKTLVSRGITQINNVYVDDSIFDQNFMHPNWPVEQQQKRYVAQVGGLNLNGNCVDFYLRTGSIGQTVEYRTEPATKYISVRNTCTTGGSNAVWLSRKLGGNDVILRGEEDRDNQEPASVTVHDPPMFAGTFLAETLERNGVHVIGQVLRDRTIRQAMSANSAVPTTKPADRWLPVAVHSTPLAIVMARAHKDSINLYAECVCKRIGAAVSGNSGSWENGTAAVSDFLRSVGVEAGQFNLDDGCGLSKKNTISPAAMIHVLEHDYFGANRDFFINSLAVGGVDGTLKDRFREPAVRDLKGRVFGKSGYVDGVRSLSGYLKSKDGQWYTFAILFNGLPASDYGVKLLQERIVQAVDAAHGAGRVATGQ